MNIIYKHTCKITGLSYIGKTGATLEKRLKQHLASSVGSNTKFHIALEQHSIYNFQSEILESNIPNDEINEKEIYYISKFDTFNNGYNMTKGGGLTNHSELTKLKMRKPKTESHKNSMRKPKTEEAKINMSNAQKGRTITAEHANKISEAHIGKILPQEVKDKISKTLTGKVHSAESRKKYSECSKGAKNNSAKKINIYDSEGNLKYECHGNFITVCEDNNLPVNSLKNTYSKNNKLYEDKRSQTLASNKGLIQFKGWYARIV